VKKLEEMFPGVAAFLDATEREVPDPKTNTNVKPTTAGKRRNTP
jgi:hypothetical protein